MNTNEDHLNKFPVEELKNAFVIMYGDIQTPIVCDGRGMNEEQRTAHVKKVIAQIQSGANFTRDIIAQSGNVYFVY